ncbi:UDP-glucoronosyl and UDP-glucosyl transferase domain-containing protein [Ditylenchus destructor]|uniref:glucuronosyltransferase n=1 Tax=Ditylenchus destructor TaxID=166010 RepID=A0AAD4NG24_9BILA|nr:UDP-glucoronosyl and UDP-glucosyl transferase domain-containing protein [Ditylenchus destructor]
MMRQVGEEFEIATTNITWMQIFMYDFGFGQIKRPKQWKSVVLDRTGQEETRLIREGGALLWETTIPVDHDRLWDVRGSLLFINILQRNQKLCEEFLKMPKFHHFMQTNRATLLVVDHFIQECFSMTASLLNVTTVQFSNWPIADGYITSLNVPAPPSAFPKTGTINSFFHTCIVIARSIQNWVINAFYARMGYPQVEMNDVESKHIFYAGRSEFVVEVVRPISNRIKHFGCIDCSAPEEHWIKQPAMARLSIYPTTHSHPEGHHANVDRNASPPLHNSSVSITLNNNTTCSCAATCHRIIRLPNKIDFEAQEITNRRISNTSLNDSFIKAQQNVRRVANETVLEQRYLVTQSEYPDIDLGMLEIHRFVLVSFGSVAKMEFMPDILLDTFLWAFSNCTRTILWQTNSPRKIIEQRLKGRRVPPNVHLLQWAPIRILLAHHNLHYAILHGGINTINEVLMFGVPVLGVPLQGDQPSNLQRLVELGVGQIIDIKGIWNGQFPAVMNDMEKNHVQCCPSSGGGSYAAPPPPPASSYALPPPPASGGYAAPPHSSRFANACTPTPACCPSAMPSCPPAVPACPAPSGGYTYTAPSSGGGYGSSGGGYGSSGGGYGSSGGGYGSSSGGYGSSSGGYGSSSGYGQGDSYEGPSSYGTGGGGYDGPAYPEQPSGKYGGGGYGDKGGYGHGDKGYGSSSGGYGSSYGGGSSYGSSSNGGSSGYGQGPSYPSYPSPSSSYGGSSGYPAPSYFPQAPLYPSPSTGAYPLSSALGGPFRPPPPFSSMSSIDGPIAGFEPLPPMPPGAIPSGGPFYPTDTGAFIGPRMPFNSKNKAKTLKTVANGSKNVKADAAAKTRASTASAVVVMEKTKQNKE